LPRRKYLLLCRAFGRIFHRTAAVIPSLFAMSVVSVFPPLSPVILGPTTVPCRGRFDVDGVLGGTFTHPVRKLDHAMNP
jgi:hypothetical protein